MKPEVFIIKEYIENKEHVQRSKLRLAELLLLRDKAADMNISVAVRSAEEAIKNEIILLKRLEELCAVKEELLGIDSE